MPVLRPQVLIILASVVAIGYLALVPLGYLLWTSFFNETGFTFDLFRDAYSGVGIPRMIGTSLVFSFGSTVFALLIGTTLAYLSVRTDMPYRHFVFVISLVPLIIPGILHTIAWIFLLSPRVGVLNSSFIEPVLGRTFDVFSVQGAIWVEGMHLSPLVFLLMAAAFRSMDPSLEESALTSGASLSKVFLSITMPLARPAFLAAALVMIVRSLESFEVPTLLLLPRGIHVFTSRIWQSLQGYPPEVGEAGAYSLSLLVLTSLGVYLINRVTRRSRSFATVSGKGFRPRVMELGRLRWVATGVVFSYFAIAIVLPLAILAYVSTQPYYSVPSLESLSNMSLENYRYTLGHRGSLDALKNSFVLGIGAATSVMLVTAIAAWLVVRTKLPGRWLVDNLAFLPLVVPGLVMGVAILFVYLRHPLPIYGTIWILLIAYMTRYMPYGMRYASSTMIQISGELEESARMSGATWWQIFRKIDIPLLMPGLVAGWVYIVTVSVRELSSSILLYSPGNEVLSIRIFEQYENGQFPELASLGIVMITCLIVLIALARKVGAHFSVTEAGTHR